jgi:uncharacterized membrane protein
MRKLLLLLLVFGLAVTSGNVYAQDEQAGDQTEGTVMEEGTEEGTEEGMGEAEEMMKRKLLLLHRLQLKLSLWLI